MRNIFKQYCELGKEVKSNLWELYLIQEFERALDCIGNLNYITMSDEELILDIAKECTSFTYMDSGEIIYRILLDISEGELTIHDLKQMHIEEVVNLISYGEEELIKEQEDIEILAEFTKDNCHYRFYRDFEKYFVSYTENNKTTVVIFDDLEQPIIELVNRVRINKIIF